MSERQARIAANDARLLAKAKSWQWFWTKLLIVIGGFFFLFVLLLGTLIGSAIYLGRNASVSSRAVSPPSNPVVSPSSSINKEEQPFPRHKSPSSTASSKPFVESKAEKLYERIKGVEVVHKKDGTTYERKAAKKHK